ncbi:MAG: outer membrane protein assembly factor BamA [Candidatus Omnitrophota bacterium]|nr:outer membrane protein assembly factor BamA [Candidatus Omnitrophota bacterium]
MEKKLTTGKYNYCYMVNYRLRYLIFGFIFSFALVSSLYAQGSQTDASSSKGSIIEDELKKQEEEALGLDTGAVLLQEADSREASGKEEEKKVVLLDIKGNKTIATSVILSKIKLRVSQDYSANIVRDDIKRLYGTGYFSDIKVNLEDAAGGLKVVFVLKEKPLIEKVNFKGFKSLSLEKVRSVINTKQGQYLDYSKIKQDIKEIKALYEKKGFSSVSIEENVKLDTNEEKAEVEFTAGEGRRLKVRKITILGLRSYKEKRILKLIKTKKKKFFSAGLLKEDVLEEDMQRILSFYKSNGFIDVKVDKNVERGTELGNIYIAITIDEGRQYKLGTIQIKGNKVASVKDLEGENKLMAGDIYTEESVRDNAAAIQSYYFEKGYIFARIDIGTSLNSDTGEVDIVYNITENELAYVNRINIRGNIKTRDKIIRRELRINPGEQLDGVKLKRSRERLNNLGFFEEGSVNFDIADTSEPDKKDLIVEVKEAKTGEFSFGGGYSSVDQFIGFVEIAQRNFDFKNFNTFTGAGQDLRLKTQLGSVSSSFELSFTEPWIFDYPLSFGFDAYNTGHKRESSTGYGYDETRTGGDLRLSKELSEFLKGGLVYRIESVEIGDVASDSTNDLKQEEGVNLISSLGMNLTRDSRDNIFSPTKGTVLSGSVELAGGPFAGDKDFYRLAGSFIYDHPLFKVGKVKRGEDARYSVLELRARVGIVDEFSDSDSVPIYERFYLGGSNSVRGYNERKIGPIDAATEDPLGGEAMILGNIEYTYPLLDFIKGAAFYDIGNVWVKSNDLGGSGFKAGVGLGLRIRTPLGPVKLDYGIPLNEEPGEDSKTGKFHFSISRGF